MVTWIGRLLGTSEAEFVSEFDVATSVDRLRSALRKPWSGRRSMAYGQVARDRVVLYRVGWFRNAFMPIFRGRFVEQDGRIVLQGVFGSLHVVTLVALWPPIPPLLDLAFLYLGDRTSGPGANGAPWFQLGFLLLWIPWVGMIRMFRWFSRGDVPWLAALIRASLTTDPAARPATAAVSGPAG